MYQKMQKEDPVYPVVSLFNLEDDPQETTNLADDHPELVEELLKEIEKALPEDLRPHFLKQKWWFFYHPFLIALAAVDVVLVWFE